VFAKFNAQKEAIYALYRGSRARDSNPSVIAQALEYYGQFYKTINDPGHGSRIAGPAREAELRHRRRYRIRSWPDPQPFRTAVAVVRRVQHYALDPVPAAPLQQLPHQRVGDSLRRHARSGVHVDDQPLRPTDQPLAGGVGSGQEFPQLKSGAADDFS